MKDWKRSVITWEPGNKNKRFGLPANIQNRKMSETAFLKSVQ